MTDVHTRSYTYIIPTLFPGTYVFICVRIHEYTYDYLFNTLLEIRMYLGYPARRYPRKGKRSEIYQNEQKDFTALYRVLPRMFGFAILKLHIVYFLEELRLYLPTSSDFHLYDRKKTRRERFCEAEAESYFREGVPAHITVIRISRGR